MNNMTKFITILFIALFISNNSFSQENFEMWYKLSPEIRINKEGKAWEIRWRPDDHIIFPDYWKDRLPSGRNHIARTDFMIGFNIPRFKIFSYTKYDDLNRFYTGVRLDYNTAVFNKKLLINIQERLFFGLNDESDNHYYLIQFIRYKIARKIQAGILSYGKFEFNWPFSEDEEAVPFKDNHWFMGPTVNFNLPLNFNIHCAFTKSIFYDNTYMTFIRLGYRIKLKPVNLKNKVKYSQHINNFKTTTFC